MTPVSSLPSLDFCTLSAAYASGEITPATVISKIHERIAARGDDKVWIHLMPRAEALAAARRLEARKAAGETLTLYGVPFAVKDNLDVAGLPTTAACPEFGYIAKTSSPVVQALVDAGAIVMGKTNLDQFATGLAGVRSPYGAPSSVFNAEYISGGSSSGSAVAVAAGLVGFSLGTDTAGSGRVPAAFNNLVGWKPTRGLLSTTGLVPACRSLDCVSVFALTADDARAVARVASAFDAADAFARRAPQPVPALPAAFRFGVPAAGQLEFFGDEGARGLFAQAATRLESIGGTRVEIDFAPFRDAANLLYSGPWVAERLAAVTPFIDEKPDAFFPVTRTIIEGGRKFTAADCYRATYQLEALRRLAEAEWAKMDVLFLPTTGTIYTHAQVAEEPVKLNTNLGHYTNFVNLLDLCGVAVPGGFRDNGLPFGVTLLAPAFHDDAVCALGGRLHAALGGKLGATETEIGSLPPPKAGPVEDTVLVSVVGAHLSGQPLNHQLTSRGGILVRTTRTAADYRLYSLPNTTPPKPGLVRAPGFAGAGVEVEVWKLSAAAFGRFTAEVPAPMGIGNVALADGSSVKGFMCETAALDGAEDITSYGGWRAFRARGR